MIPEETEKVANQVIGAAIEVHRHLGPGLLESAYETCLAEELLHLQIPFEKQKPVSLRYRNAVLDSVYRIDFLVAESVIVELKSVESIDPIHVAQVLTYLRLTHLRLALLINFNVPALRHGLKRVVL